MRYVGHGFVSDNLHAGGQDLLRQLIQLNRLEDEYVLAQASGRSTLNSQALMESLRANMPLAVLTHHDRLRSRGRKSIAAVRNGVCSGCHMNLPTGSLAEIKRQSTLVKCDTCARFLFVAAEPPEPPLPAKLPPPPKRAKRAAGVRKKSALSFEAR